MNTPRYGLPVIIAAGLHGALFLINAEPTIAGIAPPAKLIPVDCPRPADEPVAMKPAEPDADDTAAAGGPVKALPAIADIPPLRDSATFTVPVAAYQPVFHSVKDLGDYRGQLTGPGDGPAQWGSPAIAAVDQLDRVPRAVVRRAPAYPDGPRREGLDGSVTVVFDVDTTGRVTKAEAVRWTRREFVEPAVRAVLGWRFEPGTQGGRKVRFRMAVPVEFVNAAH